MYVSRFRTLMLVTTAIGIAGSAFADEPAPTPSTDYEEIIVYGSDKVGLIETTPRDSLFGIDKPLTETPRAATFISDQTLLRYGIEEVDDLMAIAPGSFTASYFGVKGSVNLRGTIAETYYRGFKRIENRGTYQTPLAAAESIEILRGPPTALFGAGKVGGFLNISPRSGRDANGQIKTRTTGNIEVTTGSYDKFNLGGNLTLPVEIGNIVGAVNIYAEYENSGSFYKGVHPEHKLLQMASDFDLNDTTTLAVGALIYNSSGYIQTPGWNRLTQDLVDTGTYITGRDTTIKDTNGDGRIAPNEIGSSLIAGYFGTKPNPNARFTLDEGVGTAKLDRRTVMVSDADFSETDTKTFYADLSKKIGDSTRLRVQGFYDQLKNQRFVSYGFPAWYEARIFELRGSADFALDLPAIGLESKHVVGMSYRDYNGFRKESFNSGYVALDRRDLTYGATATDIFADPFSMPSLGWDNDIKSTWNDIGAFLMSDMTFGGLVNVMLGARYDWYKLDSTDRGKSTGSSILTAATSGGDFTWNASVSLKTGTGLIPYFTYAKSSAIEGSQAGDVSPGLISNGQWLSDSDLIEGGVKFDLFNSTLVGALSAYRQNRTRLSTFDRVVGTTGKGVELEARWLVNDNISLTFAGNHQKTIIEGPDTAFTYISPEAMGIDGKYVYGGTYAVYNFATSPAGFPGSYELRSIPKTTFSLYGTYISEPMEWGQAGATIGVMHVSTTATRQANAVVFPSYELVNASAFVSFGQNQVTLNVNNLFDKHYFQPAVDTYVNLAALPGRGREFRLTYKRTF
ncbi:TonB-dependent siderophore receptor [Govanella unica]|uniref:TonB-dependent receptor n=1 Tax=Govanella unica TaxID=2975056 RepID=A0A9X3TVI8_9PROT|nr:TonB-dependent receptor [Govania unica]MDA5192535.1 TonB-dependent receptor [Govania unica]